MIQGLWFRAELGGPVPLGQAGLERNPGCSGGGAWAGWACSPCSPGPLLNPRPPVHLSVACDSGPALGLSWPVETSTLRKGWFWEGTLSPEGGHYVWVSTPRCCHTWRWSHLEATAPGGHTWRPQHLEDTPRGHCTWRTHSEATAPGGHTRRPLYLEATPGGHCAGK